MPPRVKITKEDVAAAAVELLRQEGAQALNARRVAAALGCSTQPVFSNFATMDKLREAVIQEAWDRYQAALAREVARGEYPPFKASGMAYIRFAREERELFRLLFMRDRSGEPTGENAAIDEQVEAMIRESTGLSPEEARLFHLESWAFVHGIAAMFATGFLALDEALISRMLTDVYQGLRARFLKEDKR